MTVTLPIRSRVNSTTDTKPSGNAIPRTRLPLGKPSPYIISAYEGESITIPGTKSTFRILASAAETDGLISVFGMDGAVADPPGFHYHNHAHDVFMCTKGRLKIWAGDKCRILYPGDFAYVPPGIVHQPQVLDKGVNETMGLVTPGQWVDFFRFVSETYDGVIADEFDTRNTGAVFGPKIREIKEKYDVVFQPQFVGAEVSDFTAEDEKLPEGCEAYFLKANTGPCYLLEGVLSRPFITTKQSAGPTGNFAITSVESSNRHKNGTLSKPFTFEKVHQVYHILDGAISLTVNGEKGNLVRAGETAFVPAGTEVAIEFVDRYVRFWSFASGDGLETLIAEAGTAFEGSIVPDQCREIDVETIKKAAEKINVKVGM
ncbi:RmlC-like cupin [Ophiobolus disseminans]|uniref:RmlC-like cupin n=1 Tax=Ophiobolus disseminans TaxID=1469910 RepID=A0A6A7AAN4_9PLEO|nr:RmlC-like cupin [Ophiobolus disseminans]